MEAELDMVFDKADDLLLAGDFEAVDKMFSVDVNTRNPAWLLTLLTATFPAKTKLPSRERFYAKVQALLGEELVKGLK